MGTYRVYQWRPSSNDQIEATYDFSEMLEKSYAGKDLDEIFRCIEDTRDLVKTHKLISWERFTDESLEGPPTYLQLIYFKTPLAKLGDYQEMERDLFHPMHKKEIALGKRAGWEGWILNRPMGNSMPYTNVAVDMYSDWQQFYAPVDNQAIMKEVHPNKTNADLMEVFSKTTEMVRIEEWRLVDYVTK